jgi:drug/metabolite transporter (DMT)-like permease
MLAIGLAVLAALLNAVASVLQRWAGRAEPDERAFSIGLLFDLVRQPVWIAGIVAIATGFLTQVVALTLGHIAMVQPLMVAELPFAILLAASVFRLRPRRPEWVAIAALTVGLALFIFCLAPGGGDPLAAPTAAWLVGLGVTERAGRGVRQLADLCGHRLRSDRVLPAAERIASRPAGGLPTRADAGQPDRLGRVGDRGVRRAGARRRLDRGLVARRRADRRRHRAVGPLAAARPR